MIIIYNKEKQKVQELVDKILQEHPEYGEVTVISDLSELPENIKINEDIIRAYEEAHKYYIPGVPNIEEFVKENKTGFQKLSSFDRKEKNKARRKLEHQALKYQNKHWRK